MSEWGNPAGLGNQIPPSIAECIGYVRRTQGTETSQYLQERKSTETPSVAASEDGKAQTESEQSGSGLRALVSSYKGIASRIRWKAEPQRVIVPYAKARALRYCRRSRVARSSWNSV